LCIPTTAALTSHLFYRLEQHFCFVPPFLAKQPEYSEPDPTVKPGPA
jgi:hypothetical protein